MAEKTGGIVNQDLLLTNYSFRPRQANFFFFLSLQEQDHQQEEQDKQPQYNLPRKRYEIRNLAHRLNSQNKDQLYLSIR